MSKSEPQTVAILTAADVEEMKTRRRKHLLVIYDGAEGDRTIATIERAVGLLRQTPHPWGSRGQYCTCDVCRFLNEHDGGAATESLADRIRAHADRLAEMLGGDS